MRHYSHIAQKKQKQTIEKKERYKQTELQLNQPLFEGSLHLPFDDMQSIDVESDQIFTLFVASKNQSCKVTKHVQQSKNIGCPSECSKEKVNVPFWIALVTIARLAFK